MNYNSGVILGNGENSIIYDEIYRVTNTNSDNYINYTKV
jgi:outer membrane lipoprotein-sorting protein